MQEPEKKKFSKKKLALICGTAAVIVIAVVFFVIRNIGGTSEGKAYVESVREITGLGLKEAKEVVDGAPKVVKEGASKEEAEEIQKKLEAEGAKVTLK